MNKTEIENEKAFLFGIAFSKHENIAENLNELRSLAETSGVDVVGEDFQIIREITPATLIGSGKLEEVKQRLSSCGANLLIIDYELTGSQCRNISDALEIKVIDRITLILDIFALRANSNEGKLQVELAQLNYNLPRLSGIQGSSGRFGSAGVGMRGPGEAKLELDKRMVRDKIKKLEAEMEKIKKSRQQQRKERLVNSKKKVALVGYTNAGKSTILNLLAKENIYADDKLFATLDTTSRSVWLAPDLQIILTDTVGFISKLPHSLVEAFSATLQEAKDADLLLHIIDCSSSSWQKQKEVVETVLKDLGTTAPILCVFNKYDKITDEQQFEGVCISAKYKTNVETLKDKIIEILSN